MKLRKLGLIFRCDCKIDLSVEKRILRMIAQSMQATIEVSHAMQSFSGKNSFLRSAANLSDVHLYQPDLGGGVEKTNINLNDASTIDMYRS